MTHVFNIDDDVKKNVRDSFVVREYLEELQSMPLTSNITLRPQHLYYITLLLFSFPTIWVAITISTSLQFSEKLYMDGCVGTGVNSSIEFSFSDCYQCANNRSFLWSRLVPIPDRVRNFQLATIIVAVFVGLAAIFTYARNVLLEHVSMHFLEYGVVTVSQFSASQLWPTVVYFFLFGTVAALNIISATQVASMFDGSIILGLKDFCDEGSRLAYQVLHAKFDKNNPSVQSSASPSSVRETIALILAVFLPFMPILSKFFAANTTTYNNRITLDALVRSQEKSSRIFSSLVYEIDEGDLLAAVKTYSERVPVTEGCCTMSNIMRHMLAGSFSYNTNLPHSFGSSWGCSLEAVHHVLTIAKHANSLRDYVAREADGSASPTLKLPTSNNPLVSSSSFTGATAAMATTAPAKKKPAEAPAAAVFTSAASSAPMMPLQQLPLMTSFGSGGGYPGFSSAAYVNNNNSMNNNNNHSSNPVSQYPVLPVTAIGSSYAALAFDDPSIL